MPEYLAPGVFVEEIDSGSKPIEGVGTNTTAFIGFAKSGDFNTPVFISNWTQFCQIFGDEENLYLRALSDETGFTARDILIGKKASRKNWSDYARSVISQLVSQQSGAVKSFPEFLRKYNIPQNNQPYLEGAYLAHALRGYYDNGGSRAYVVRVARAEDLGAIQYAPPRQSVGAARTAPAIAAVPAQAAIGPVTVKAIKAGKAGNDIRVEIEPVGEGATEARLRIVNGDEVETFGSGREKPLPPAALPGAINGKSKLVQVEVSEVKEFKFEPLVLNLAGGVGEAPEPAVTTHSPAPPMLPSLDGLADLQPLDFIGDEARRTGLGGLYAIDDINMVCAPDLMAGVFQRVAYPGMEQGAVAPEVIVLNDGIKRQILDLQCALVAYCERMGDRMAILDPIPGLSPQQMRDTTLNTAYNCDRGQAAIYYPWIRIVDPLRRGQQLMVPPCGHIAGVWARVVSDRGVHKAPANEALLGAVALEVDITRGEQEILNPEGINCIRAFPGTGIRVWGARTLATVGNPSWKYVNVRRLFNYLEKSMERGLQWTVFEPNDQDLWGRVRRNISAFLYTEWKEGKLFGATADEAYYVKCDRETNPPEMIDLGRLYVEIGVNPVKPAEFVIIRIGQWSGGSSIGEQ